MLRRPATTIQITSEDVAAYEDRRAREAQQQQQQQQQQHVHYEGTSSPPSHPNQGHVDAEAQLRQAREDRIGVGRRQQQQQQQRQ